ncbi:MAG: indolepyruvate oxidoreductase subunit beta [Bacillota bacterium]|nr:indolepyruvate oxidoreductase subunit beta [Bacillota bacterium]
MSEPTRNVLIVGVGGQGILLASRLLASAAIGAGFDVKISEVHGMAQRGGSVVTHVRLGARVHSPLVEMGTADLMVAFERLEALRWLPYARPGATVIVNDVEIPPLPVILGAERYPMDITGKLATGGRSVAVVDAEAMARAAGNARCANTAIMGVFARRLGLEIAEERWRAAVSDVAPRGTADVNWKAFSLGYTYTS